MNINKNMNNDDYNSFIVTFNHKNNKNNLFPLDNSKLYLLNGEINPLAEFIIIDKKCNEVFEISSEKKEYYVKESSVTLKFLPDKIILYISDNIRIIYFRNGNTEEEIIIVFIEQKNKDKILSYIEQQDFKFWLKDKGFLLDGPEELDIVEQGCKIKIINKNLKLKNNKLNQIGIKPIISDYYSPLMNNNFEIPHPIQYIPNPVPIPNSIQSIVNPNLPVIEDVNTQFNFNNNNNINNNINNNNINSNNFLLDQTTNMNFFNNINNQNNLNNNPMMMHNMGLMPINNLGIFGNDKTMMNPMMQVNMNNENTDINPLGRKNPNNLNTEFFDGTNYDRE